MTPIPAFHLRLFGTPSIEAEDGSLMTGRVSQRHRLALLALVALAPGGRLSRDKLLGYLWPESDPEKGRNLLKVATYILRSTLGEDALLSEGDELRLDANVVRTDAVDFEGALEGGDHTGAVALYKGPFLDGFFLSDAPEFEQWVSRERQRLAAGYSRALESLAEAAESARDPSKAAELWKLRVAQDPYDSRVALRLMQALAASGNRAGALQHAALHQRMLEQEFGMAPPAELASLVEQLRHEQAPAVTDAGAGIPRGTRAEHAPPAEPAGREQPALAGREPHRRKLILTWIGAAVLASVLVGAVWAINPGSADRERSIAILPFVDLSPARDNDYFSDGLTEEIIAGLSAVPDLKVISRTSAMHYKGSKKPLREIAGELDVTHILEGSVRQSDGRVRITAQLIDARRDEHLWAQNYNDDLRDIFKVQEQIAREVVRALSLELGERGRTALVRRGTDDPEAYELYTRGRYLWNTRTREGHVRALEYFRRAIERDSGYADAYAAVADAYRTAFQLNVSDLSEAEAFSRAMESVQRALALDESSADAHASYAITMQWEWKWSGAEREFRRAIQLKPSHATAHTWYGLLLSGMGRVPEALEVSRKAAQLDPFAVVPSGNYGWQCYLARDYDCAVAEYRRTIEIAPNYPGTYQRLGLAYAQKGMLDEAIRSMEKAVELGPERLDFIGDLAYVQALRGDQAAARATLRRAKARVFEAVSIARAHIALGEPDSAFVWLERAGWKWPHRAVRADPSLDPIRNDLRFARLSERIDRELARRQ
jgi:adenylate cyclase